MLRLYVGHRIQRLYLFPSISLYGLGYIAGGYLAGGSAKNAKGSEAVKGRAGGTERTADSGQGNICFNP